MKKSSVWQHPFVDVFKYTGVGEWQRVSKEGDVTDLIDREIGKKVFRLHGAVSASNNIQIPKPKSQLKSLGLNGRFVYVHFKVPASKLFSIHFDLTVTNAKTAREENLKVSISNLFKENRVQAAVQLSIRPTGKWTVLCLSFKSLLAQLFGDKFTFIELRSVMLCANMLVRGVYTSDIQYSPKTLPKEMSFKVTDISQWFQAYDWLMVPDGTPVDPSEETEEIKVAPPIKPKAPVPKVTPKARAIQQEKKDQRGHKLTHKQPEPKQAEKKENRKFGVKNFTPEERKAEPFGTYEEWPEHILEPKGTVPITRSCSDVLVLPTQALADTSHEITQHTDKLLVYSSSSFVVLQNPVTLSQLLLRGHSGKIERLSLSADFRTLLSAEQKTLFFWDLKTRRPPVSFTPTQFTSIKVIEFSESGKLLVCGLDEYSRFLLVVYDTTNIHKKKETVHVAAQLSEVHVNNAKWIDQARLVTCGKGSVKFWRVKNGHLPNTAVNLEAHSLCEFLGLAVFPGVSKKVLAGTNTGLLLQINATTREIEASFTLHSGPLNAIQPSGDFVITVSDDCKLNVWPGNFQESYLEVQHKGKVTAATVCHSKIACSTPGSIGCLDMSSNQYLTVTAKAESSALAIAVRGSLLGTITEADQVVVYDVAKSATVVVEFTVKEEVPTALTFDPDCTTVACGYRSGIVRVMDLMEGSVLQEHNQHASPIDQCEFSSDGQFLTSLGQDGSLAIYKDGETVKFIEVDRPSDKSSVSVSRCSQFIALTGNYGNEVGVWSTSSLHQKYRIKAVAGTVDQLQFTSSGHLVLLVQSSVSILQTYFITQQSAGLVLQREMPVALTTFCVSPNSRYILGAALQDLLVLDFHGSRDPQVFSTHQDAIRQVQWSEDTLLSFSWQTGLVQWKFSGDPTPYVPEEVAESVQDNVEVLSDSSDEPEDILEALEDEVQAYLAQAELVQNTVPPHTAELRHIVGYTQGHNLVLAFDSGWYVHSVGNVLVKTALDGTNSQVFLEEHMNCIGCIATSSDNKLIASAEQVAGIEATPQIILWHADDCRALRTFAFHERFIQDLAFSPCSQFLVVVGGLDDYILVVYEVSTGRVVNTSVLLAPPQAVQWLPNIACLEFATLSRTGLVFWRLNEMRQLELQEAPAQPEEMTCFHYSPYIPEVSGHLLYVGTASGEVLIYNARTNSFVVKKPAIEGPVTQLLSKETRLIVAGTSPYLHCWANPLFNGAPDQLLLDGHCVASSFNKTGTEGLVTTTSGTLWYINLEENATIKIWNSHTQATTHLTSSANLLASASTDLSIKIWQDHEQLVEFKSPYYSCNCLAFHPSERFLIGGFDDGSVKYFDLQHSRCIGTSSVFAASVTSLRFNSTGEFIVAGSSSGQVRLLFILDWDVFTVEIGELAQLSERVLSVDASHENRYMLATTDQGKLIVWEKKLTAQNITQTQVTKATEFNVFDSFSVLDPSKFESKTNVEALETNAVFSDNSQVVLLIVRGVQFLMYRNTVTHQIVKRISLSGYPCCLSLRGTRVAVGLADRRVILYENGEVQDLSGHSDSVVAVTHYKEGVITTSSNEIFYWVT